MSEGPRRRIQAARTIKGYTQDIHVYILSQKGVLSKGPRRCTFCATAAIGDERHCVFDCPHFQGLRQQHAQIFRDSHDAMTSVMWHRDQKSVCALVLAIVNEAQTL